MTTIAADNKPTTCGHHGCILLARFTVTADDVSTDVCLNHLDSEILFQLGLPGPVTVTLVAGRY